MSVGPKGKAHLLYPHLIRPGVLEAAYELTWKRAGRAERKALRRRCGEGERLAAYLDRIRRDLKEGNLKPARPWYIDIPKADGGVRRICIPGFAERLVQRAVLKLIEPLFEAGFHDVSHGFRPGRGPQSAIHAVAELVNQGYYHIARLDIASCFDRLDLDILDQLLRERIWDQRMLDLINQLIRAGRPWAHRGVPQGYPLAPLLMNVYLNIVDRKWAEGRRTGVMVRYADDIIVACQTREEAETALVQVKKALKEIRLEPSQKKPARVYDLDSEGMRFLGVILSRRQSPRGGSQCYGEKPLRTEKKEIEKPETLEARESYYRSITGWL